jgi:hypothetical protein
MNSATNKLCSPKLPHKALPKTPSPKQRITQAVNQWLAKKLNKPPQAHAIEEFKFTLKQTKPALETSALHLKLKKQHKTGNLGTQILNLPKLPFGKHETYNTDFEFSKKHFVMSVANLTPRQRKELDEIANKFRLADKRKKRRYKSIEHTIFTSGVNREFMPTPSGELSFAKDRDVIRAYQGHPTPYLGKANLFQTSRGLNRHNEFLEQEIAKRTKSLHASIDLEQSSTRLHLNSRLLQSPRPIPVGLAKRFEELHEITIESKKWLRHAKESAHKHLSQV